MDGNFDSSILAPCVVANLSVAYCEHLRLYLADMYILYIYIYIFIIYIQWLKSTRSAQVRRPSCNVGSEREEDQCFVGQPR